MPIEIKAWKCRWCNKVSRTKSGIMLHEDRCRSNPDFKCCTNCVHAYNAAAEYIDGTILFCDLYCNYHGRSIFVGEDKSQAAYFVECDTDDGCGWNRKEAPIPYTCWGFESKGVHGFVDEPEWLEKYKRKSEQLKIEYGKTAQPEKEGG